MELINEKINNSVVISKDYNAKFSECYYDITTLWETGSPYCIAYGGRSNGKTFSTLKLLTELYFDKGIQFLYLRRYDDDIKPKRMSKIFSDMTENRIIQRASGGKYTHVVPFNGALYPAYYDEKFDKYIKAQEPMCYTMALNTQHHDKSNPMPNVKIVLFEEFMERTYLEDEFILFANVISSLARNKKDFRVIMLANTITKYCPYFNEMGLFHAKNQKMGTIETYKYGDSRLSVSVEYTRQLSSSKRVNSYLFAFDNPKLRMITDGAWELGIYPRLPFKYNRDEVKYKFFIEFDDEKFQCEILKHCKDKVLYIHRKTYDFKNEKDLIFSIKQQPSKYRRMNILLPIDNITKTLCKFFIEDNVYYQDNEVGNTIANYLEWCKKNKSVTSIR